MALRTGIAPSELKGDPLLYAAVVEELAELDKAQRKAARQARLAGRK